MGTGYRVTGHFGTSSSNFDRQERSQNGGILYWMHFAAVTKLAPTRFLIDALDYTLTLNQWRAATLIAIMIVASACSRGAAVGITAVESRDVIPANCVLAWTESARNNAVIHVGVTDALDQTLLDQSRLRANVYETLVGSDCNGRLVPGYAVDWERKNGERWIFRLRDSIALSDGITVTASSLASFLARRTQDTGIVESVVATDDRTIEIVLAQADSTFPKMLSDQRYAFRSDAVVSPETRARPSELGTGPFEFGYSGGANVLGAHKEALVLRERFPQGLPEREPVGSASVDDARTRIVVRDVSSGGDLRDLLADSLDVLITRRHDVIDFGNKSQSLSVVPMTTGRQYSIVVPSRFGVLSSGRALPRLQTVFPKNFLQSLSEDVLRGHAVPVARSDTAGHSPSAELDCAFVDTASVDRKRTSGAGVSPASPKNRIVFDAADPVARDIAERISVVIAARMSRVSEVDSTAAAIPGLESIASGPRAVGISDSELDTSLVNGEDLLYIVSEPTDSADGCHFFAELAANAQWITSNGSQAPNYSDLQSLYIQSRMQLVVAFEYAILVKNRFRMAIDGRGNLIAVTGDTARREEERANK